MISSNIFRPGLLNTFFQRGEEGKKNHKQTQQPDGGGYKVCAIAYNKYRYFILPRYSVEETCIYQEHLSIHFDAYFIHKPS